MYGVPHADGRRVPATANCDVVTSYDVVPQALEYAYLVIAIHSATDGQLAGTDVAACGMEEVAEEVEAAWTID